MKKYLGIVTGEHWTEKVFFRVLHPFFPTLVFGTLSILLVGWAQYSRAYPLYVLVAFFAAGLFLWTLTEYLLHRFVFHWTSVSEPWRTLASGLHMAHHRDPQDKSLIIAPPMVALVDSLLIFLIFWGLFQSAAASAILIAGLYTGYIAYEWVHYGSHQYAWKRGLGKYLKRYHLAHHFQRPKEVFGVTNPFWDKIFGTH